MKKKIVILGSTGSIGRHTLNIIKKNKESFDIKILSANKNINLLINQAKQFKVKHLIISDYSKFLLAKKKYKDTGINFYNSFSIIEKILGKKEIYYTMISVVGLIGLEPCIRMIKFSQNIAIANKESIIAGWNIIKKKLNYYNTKFIPIDSEHFSIFSLMNQRSKEKIYKIFLTASGGPFLNYSKSQLKKVSLKQSLQHPNWKMGKKISIDSATMMNKIFEVIEAKKIFELEYNQIEILIHPRSYVHSLILFNNGIIKFLAHDPDMSIPIKDSLLDSKNKINCFTNINFDILNNLNFNKINIIKFPLIKILQNLPKKNTMYETVLITINDFFVSLYLKKKISFLTLIKLINKYAFHKDFIKFKKIETKNLKQIFNINKYVYFKLKKLHI